MDSRASARCEFRTAQLAETLGISLPNANNRLQRLVEAGALHRQRGSGPDRGGKEFTYRVSRPTRTD
ncbi:winged helix-turn-helix transcriptional regulator [Streptomyces sp. NPDC051920]|uniref:winged helix-turn-helix transcriptional regulator n=1 Tax=Streptomyces sp. NPDC051920 TaxID=3155523 RepID=UPI00342DEAB6